MTQRRYTVDEIDSMREAVGRLNAYVAYVPPYRSAWREISLRAKSGQYYAATASKNIEDKLRTYMVGGVDPKDLIRRGDRKYATAKRLARMRQSRENRDVAAINWKMDNAEQNASLRKLFWRDA